MKRSMIRAFSILLALLFVLPMGAFAADDGAVTTTAADTGKVITIFHTNDVHSRTGNYPLIAALMAAARAEDPNTLLFDAGDTLHGQTIATLEKGESIVKILNAVGYDAMTPGNHDFNYGYERLVELSKSMKFPLLSANVYNGADTLFAPYEIFEKDGIKIAVIGVSTPETTYKTHPDNVKGLDFKDPVASVTATVAKVRADVDAVILLAHIGIDKESQVKATDLGYIPGVDLIIDGHSHSVLPDYLIEGYTGAPITSTGEYGANLGGVALLFDDSGKLVYIDRILIDLSKINSTDPEGEGYLAPSAEVAAIIKGVEDAQKPLLEKVVGHTDVELLGAREQVRGGLTNLGALVTAAMLAESGAQIALTNGGGIRAPIPAGDITMGQIVTVLPFGNYIVTKELKGSDVIAFMEYGLRMHPELNAGYPHFAGMDVVYNPAAEPGSRVVSITVGGAPINPNGTYVVATNDFMAAGGDGYTMFGAYPIANEFAALDEAVINYLQSGKAIPDVGTRLTEAAPEEPKPPVDPEPDPEPEPEPEPPVEPDPDPKPPTSTVTISHIVEKGDTLIGIAVSYGLTVDQLAALNGLKKPYSLKVGQELQIGTFTSDSPVLLQPGQKYYTVKAGDTLSAIAAKYKVKWQDLYELNKATIKNANLIYEGQRIKVPG